MAELSQSRFNEILNAEDLNEKFLLLLDLYKKLYDMYKTIRQLIHEHDTDPHAHEATNDGIAEDISNLNERVTNLVNTEISNLQAQLNTAENRINNDLDLLRANQVSMQNDLTRTINEGFTQLNSDLANTNTSLSDLSNRVDALELDLRNRISNLSTALQDTETTLADAIADIRSKMVDLTSKQTITGIKSLDRKSVV